MDIIAKIYQGMYAPKEPEQLQEKLDEYEKGVVDSWDQERQPHVEEAIHKVFQGKDRISIPLGQNIDSEPHPEVSEHIESTGHVIKDYLKGIAASKKDGREISIGKLLARSNAPKHVVSAYANDPARQATKVASDNLHVVISHHPHDVAGMTSRGHSWYGESCQNFNTGSYRNHLPVEVKNGTHVAYLCHKGDDKAESPIARIAIKPFHHQDDEEKVIFRPEMKVYGKGGDLFHSTVSNWAQHHYPAEGDTTYTLAEGSYQDTRGSYSEPSADSIKKFVEKGHPIHGIVGDSYKGANIAMKHALAINEEKNLELEDLHGPDSPFKNEFIKDFANTNFRIKGDPRYHNKIARIIASGDGEKSSFEKTAIRAYSNWHGRDYDSDNIERVLKHFPPSELSTGILANRKLPESVVDQLHPRQLKDVHDSKIKPHHMNKVIDHWANDESGSAYVLDNNRSRMAKENLEYGIEKVSGEPAKLSHFAYVFKKHIEAHPELNEKIFDKIYSNGSHVDVINYITNHMSPHLIEPHHIDAFHEALSKSTLLNDTEKWQQFGRLINSKHNTFDGEVKPMKEETGKYAWNKFMEGYGNHFLQVHPAYQIDKDERHVGINAEHIPANYFTDEHIEKLHNEVPLFLDADFDVHNRLHEKRLDKLEDLTEKHINGEHSEEESKAQAEELEREHKKFAFEMGNHLDSEHMKVESEYDESEDHKNRSPGEDAIATLKEHNDRAEELEDDAHDHSDHFERGPWHEENRDTLSVRHHEHENYLNRYDNWY